MKTLLIYDDTGYIYSQITGTFQIPSGGIQYLITEIPEGQIVKNIDTTKTPNVPNFEDIPKSEVETIQEQLLATQAELANLKEQLLLK